MNSLTGLLGRRRFRSAELGSMRRERGGLFCTVVVHARCGHDVSTSREAGTYKWQRPNCGRPQAACIGRGLGWLWPDSGCDMDADAVAESGGLDCAGVGTVRSRAVIRWLEGDGPRLLGFIAFPVDGRSSAAAGSCRGRAGRHVSYVAAGGFPADARQALLDLCAVGVSAAVSSSGFHPVAVVAAAAWKAARRWWRRRGYSRLRICPTQS